MISALIFDLDGTLFNNSEANVRSYEQAFKDLNLSFDAEKYRLNFGLRFDRMMDALIPNTGLEIRQKIKEKKAKYYQQNFSFVQPNHDLLSFATDSKVHYKTALVTTASRHNVEQLLQHFLPNHNLFDTVITGENVHHSKPDPECYLLAFEALSVGPASCVIFEDSDIGVEAARRSGASVIRVKI